MPCIPTAQPCQVLTFCHIWFKIFFPRDNTSQIQVEPQGMCLSCPLSSHSRPPRHSLQMPAPPPHEALLPVFPGPSSGAAARHHAIPLLHRHLPSLGLLCTSMYTSALPP